MTDIRTCASRGRDPLNPSDRKHHSNGRFRQRLEIGGVFSNALTSVAKDSLVFIKFK